MTAKSRAENRTGIMTAGTLAEAMVAATQEFPPSSPGDARAMAAVRVAYAQAGETFGEAPPPATLLLDKLGERLAFEHAGARLYEALLSKHQAYGSFRGGPSADDLLHILEEEYEHADVLKDAMIALGGDPTALTPSANLAVNISVGIPQVLADPRTNLLQCLEAILVAELSDNECWTTLEALARQADQDELAEECREALDNEREHLMKVRGWLAAGHGRADGSSDAEPSAASATATDASSEFTFSSESRTDREGYVISDEEAGEASKPSGKPKRRR